MKFRNRAEMADLISLLWFCKLSGSSDRVALVRSPRTGFLYGRRYDPYVTYDQVIAEGRYGRIDVIAPDEWKLKGVHRIIRDGVRYDEV